MRYLLIFLVLIAFTSLSVYSQQEAKPKAYIVSEFGKISTKDFRARYESFIKKLCDKSLPYGSIMIYGTAREKIAAIKRINEGPLRRDGCGNDGRLKVVDAGEGKARTVFWIVPAGAEDPMQ